jgi:hypothetical protein
VPRVHAHARGGTWWVISAEHTGIISRERRRRMQEAAMGLRAVRAHDGSRGTASVGGGTLGECKKRRWGLRAVRAHDGSWGTASRAGPTLGEFKMATIGLLLAQARHGSLLASRPVEA